ncbi:MAG: penicillin-binding transpeptidase domain-containing protein, partial [Eubacteriales bacterium]
SRITDETKSQVWIKRQVDSSITDVMKTMDLPGVGYYTETKRYYPNGAFLTQVLGITSTDGEGLEGIEGRYDLELSGEDGRLVGETDRLGNTIPYGDSMYIPAENGNNIVLTIDEVIQMFLESALEDAVKEHQAVGAQGIVMNPKTGEILAIANYPDFDLNNPPRNDSEILQDRVRNKVFTDAYEPGSTFKIITAASVLDSGAMTVADDFECVGYSMVDGKRINCWRSYLPHGKETFEEALKNSCNPAFMDMALAMGTNIFYDYIYKFGFGAKTGVETIYESDGIVQNIKYIKDYDLAHISFGQSIAVTPLQLITAVSAVINGGELMKPMLVKEIVDADGYTVKEFEPEVVHRVISEETSQTMCELLQTVVNEGGGTQAQIEGYKVGGKTGTAQKYGDNGEILEDKYIASFIGFAPATDAELVVLILVDEPSEGEIFGSVVAAPYVKEVLESSLKYLGIPATHVTENSYVSVPNVTGLSSSMAAAAIEKSGLNFIMDGTGKVVSQIPAPGEEMAKGGSVQLYMSAKTTENAEYVDVPNVVGLTLEEATQILSDLGLEVYVEQQGEIVTNQSIPSGFTVQIGTIITLTGT